MWPGPTEFAHHSRSVRVTPSTPLQNTRTAPSGGPNFRAKPTNHSSSMLEKGPRFLQPVAGRRDRVKYSSTLNGIEARFRSCFVLALLKASNGRASVRLPRLMKIKDKRPAIKFSIFKQKYSTQKTVYSYLYNIFLDRFFREKKGCEARSSICHS